MQQFIVADCDSLLQGKAVFFFFLFKLIPQELFTNIIDIIVVKDSSNY